MQIRKGYTRQSVDIGGGTEEAARATAFTLAAVELAALYHPGTDTAALAANLAGEWRYDFEGIRHRAMAETVNDGTPQVRVTVMSFPYPL